MLETELNESGLSFFRTEYDGNGKMTNRDTLFSADIGGVFIGKLYSAENSNEYLDWNQVIELNRMYTELKNKFHYGYDEPKVENPTEGMIYFKIVN